MWNKIESPSLIIDEERIKNNIRNMAEKAARLNLSFRPHFKTHQSLLVGEFFRDFGVEKIAVSSLAMADYFAQRNWEDIMLAVPVNIREIKRINQLAARINLGLLVENAEAATFLLSNLKTPVDIWLKIDTGYHRTGLEAETSLQLEEILQVIAHSDHMILRGLVAHSGHTYSTVNTTEVEEIHNNSLSLLSALKAKLASRFPDLKISLGDTPSCSICQNFEGVDEMRPGVFVFYDWMQYRLGACTTDDIAMIAALPVLAKHKQRNELIVHGGAVHLSKDHLINTDGSKYFGQVVHLDTWQAIDGAYVKKLSQEHGTIHLPEHVWDQYQVGGLIGIMPVHACLTANLHTHYFNLKGEMILKM